MGERASVPACLIAAALLVLAACHRSAATTEAEAGAVAVGDAAAPRSDGALADEDPLLSDLWARAADGDEDDRARLLGRVGTEGLIADSLVPARRPTALRALGLAEDFGALPFLAGVATTGSETDAALALESVAGIANRPRRATDPEDALEVREGITALLALARDAKRPSPRRLLAVRALRLLADRGWVPREEIPGDLDAR